MVKGKGGASHFEMIISFVFFVGFVFFLFLFLKPYDTTILSGAVVTSLYDTFEEEVHTNLTNFFLKANYTEGKDCFYVKLSKGIFAYAFTKSNVTDIGGNYKSSYLDDEELNIKKDGTVYYRVAISPEFNELETLDCIDELENEDGNNVYTLGSILERRVISYSSLEEMKLRYDTDYENLKEELKVPDAFEFFIVSEEFPEISMKGLVPDSVEVVAYDYVMEVLKKDGTVINSRFTLGVW
jgi:hypothetical protein